MKQTFVLTILVVLLNPPALAGQKPNVLLITIDDLNDWIGCLAGHPQAKTPNIDRLAKRGVLFANAHCQAPICNPSRVSFMTGVRPSTSGVYLNNVNFRRTDHMAEAVTLPQHFAANGYHTYGVGKLFHASGERGSFQTYGPAKGQGPLPKQKLNCPLEQSQSRLWDWGAYPANEADTHDAQDADWAAERLGAEHDKPFFLGVGFYRPHVPFYAPQSWFDQFPLAKVKLPIVLADDLADLPAFGKELTHNPLPPSHEWFVKSNQWDDAVQAYLACVAFVDDCVGKVIDALDKGPNADDTWIVLLSDHGFFLGEKERWAKQALWERATRVPLIVIPPRARNTTWASDTRCDSPVELLSIYPTLVEVCGLSTREGLEGRSIVPLLKDSESAWTAPAITTHQRNNHSVRSRRWRYIRYADGSEELYDHKNDPNEWQNVAGDSAHKEIIAEHRKWLPTTNRPKAVSKPAKRRRQRAKSARQDPSS